MGRWAGNGRCVLCSELFLDGPYGLRGSKKGMYYAKLFTFEKSLNSQKTFGGSKTGQHQVLSPVPVRPSPLAGTGEARASGICLLLLLH